MLLHKNFDSGHYHCQEILQDRKLGAIDGSEKKRGSLLGNDGKIMAQWRKCIVIWIVVQEIDRAENVDGASVG